MRRMHCQQCDVERNLSDFRHVASEGPPPAQKRGRRPRCPVCRHLPFMEALGVPYEMHMFVDTLNAPPDAIGGTAFRVAEQLGASLIVTTTDCYVSADQSLNSPFDLNRTFLPDHRAGKCWHPRNCHMQDAVSGHSPSSLAYAQTTAPAQSRSHCGFRPQGSQHACLSLSQFLAFARCPYGLLVVCGVRMAVTLPTALGSAHKSCHARCTGGLRCKRRLQPDSRVARRAAVAHRVRPAAYRCCRNGDGSAQSQGGCSGGRSCGCAA